MIELIIYPLKVSVCMIILYGCFVITLKKETHFRFNRIYLLFSLLISLIMPLLNIPFYPVNAETGFVGILQTVQVSSDNVFIKENSFSSSKYIIIIYLTGLILLLIRFLVSLISIFLIRRQCIIQMKNGLSIAQC